MLRKRNCDSHFRNHNAIFLGQQGGSLIASALTSSAPVLSPPSSFGILNTVVSSFVGSHSKSLLVMDNCRPRLRDFVQKVKSSGSDQTTRRKDRVKHEEIRSVKTYIARLTSKSSMVSPSGLTQTSGSPLRRLWYLVHFFILQALGYNCSFTYTRCKSFYDSLNRLICTRYSTPARVCNINYAFIINM